MVGMGLEFRLEWLRVEAFDNGCGGLKTHENGRKQVLVVECGRKSVLTVKTGVGERKCRLGGYKCVITLKDGWWCSKMGACIKNGRSQLGT